MPMPADMIPDPRLQRLMQGECHDPFGVLGRHPAGDGEVIREMLPQAERAWIVDAGEMQRIEGTDIFEYRLTGEASQALSRHYRVEWLEKHDGQRHGQVSPYSFLPLIGDEDLYYFGLGKHHHAYRFLGAHPRTVDGVTGVQFGVWAPGAKRVSVVGDFNGWHGLRHMMRVRGGSGVWELFVPGLQPGDLYKFEILGPAGVLVLKTDPYAFRMTLRPDTACRVATPTDAYRWGGRCVDGPAHPVGLAAPAGQHLRGPPRILAARCGRGISGLPRHCRAPGPLCAGDGVYPCRADARDGASAGRILGIPGYRLLRGHRTLWFAGRSALPDRQPAPGGHRGHPGLGAGALSA